MKIERLALGRGDTITVVTEMGEMTIHQGDGEFPLTIINITSEEEGTYFGKREPLGMMVRINEQDVP